MSVSSQHIAVGVHLKQEYIPMLRFAFGITLIMGYAMAVGGDLSYIVPYLALNFLAPGTTVPTLKKGLGFVAIVTVTNVVVFLFTSFFYNFTLVYLLLLALILFYLYYTTKLSFIVKLFMLISLLAFPVPKSGVDPITWAYAITNTLSLGSLFSVLVVWLVYALFPDKPKITDEKETADKPKNIPGPKERFYKALEILAITFPVVLLFVFFQWGDALLVLIYIVVLTMLQEASHTAGKVKIMGNLIGGLATIIFYQLIVTVPFFFFFLLLLLGTALFFATRIFSGKPTASLYKTGFSALVLIIGGVSTGTDAAGSEIWVRIFQVMIAVFYVVAALALVKEIKSRKQKKQISGV